MSRRIGFLWTHETAEGFYASGFLSDIGGDLHFKVVPNLYKKCEADAPYVLLRKEYAESPGEMDHREADEGT